MTTIIDDTVEGTVFAYDPLTNTLSLLTSAAAAGGSGGSVRILKISFLKDVAVLAAAPARPRLPMPFTHAAPPIAPVDLAAVSVRERVVARMQTSKGVGVSRDAQDIFDALSRT